MRNYKKTVQTKEIDVHIAKIQPNNQDRLKRDENWKTTKKQKTFSVELM